MRTWGARQRTRNGSRHLFSSHFAVRISHFRLPYFSPGKYEPKQLQSPNGDLRSANWTCTLNGSERVVALSPPQFALRRSYLSLSTSLLLPRASTNRRTSKSERRLEKCELGVPPNGSERVNGLSHLPSSHFAVRISHFRLPYFSPGKYEPEQRQSPNGDLRSANWTCPLNGNERVDGSLASSVRRSPFVSLTFDFLLSSPASTNRRTSKSERRLEKCERNVPPQRQRTSRALSPLQFAVRRSYLSLSTSYFLPPASTNRGNVKVRTAT